MDRVYQTYTQVIKVDRVVLHTSHQSRYRSSAGRKDPRQGIQHSYIVHTSHKSRKWTEYIRPTHKSPAKRQSGQSISDLHTSHQWTEYIRPTSPAKRQSGQSISDLHTSHQPNVKVDRVYQTYITSQTSKWTEYIRPTHKSPAKRQSLSDLSRY